MCCLTSDSPARLYNQRVTILALHHVQINVPASRAGEARRFFEELVGLQEMQRPESLSGAGRNGVWYRCGDNEFHVFFAPDSEFKEDRTSRHPAFLVDNLGELRGRLDSAHLRAAVDPLPAQAHRQLCRCES